MGGDTSSATSTDGSVQDALSGAAYGAGYSAGQGLADSLGSYSFAAGQSVAAGAESQLIGDLLPWLVIGAGLILVLSR